MAIDATKAGSDAQQQTYEAALGAAVGETAAELKKNWSGLSALAGGNPAQPSDEDYTRMAREAIESNDGKGGAKFAVKMKDGTEKLVRIESLPESGAIIAKLPKKSDLEEISSSVGTSVKTGITDTMSNWGSQIFNAENIGGFFKALLVSIKNMLGMGDGKGEGLGDFFARIKGQVTEQGTERIKNNTEANLKKLRGETTSESLRFMLTDDRIADITGQVNRKAREQAGLSTDGLPDAPAAPTLSNVQTNPLTPEQVKKVHDGIYAKVKDEAYPAIRDSVNKPQQESSFPGWAQSSYRKLKTGKAIPNDEQIHAAADTVAESSAKFMTTPMKDGRMPADLNRENGEFARAAKDAIYQGLKNNPNIRSFTDEELTTIAGESALGLRKNYDSLPLIAGSAMPKEVLDQAKNAAAGMKVAGVGSDNLGSGQVPNANAAQGTGR